ncbi:hypothetical protein LZQ00_02105 [Sphingobacterium sp. SRCM116780]|uniref:hypothetical protein n=1 Tax=Sphingobacterium sp. SRCM116780 TaxID=2907623 RepID=UPI001F3A47DB|nr:hypothetical protein [Sphingobacterium sp. SRCM116780]UIR56623.1 hypothetical protein LZQ00_02105 [Sphingobacterium sp. SRCM116780]
MKKLSWILGVTCGLMGLSNEACAQLDSKGAIGARFGSSQGLTYRHTLSNDRALEGILSIQSNSNYRRFRVVGLYEIYKPLSAGFNWYYGFGGSVGSYKEKDKIVDGKRIEHDSELGLSIDGIIGIEYNIPQTPFQLSLDVKPYFDFLQSSSIKLIDPIGFSFRYKF